MVERVLKYLSLWGRNLTDTLIVLQDLEATRVFARSIAERFANRSVALLCYGGLGVGKTTFTRQLALACGVTTAVTSPTFVGLVQHRIQDLDFYHFDLYKVPVALEELAEICENDQMRSILVFEWAENLSQEASDIINSHIKVLKIYFEITGESSRIVKLA